MYTLTNVRAECVCVCVCVYTDETAACGRWSKGSISIPTSFETEGSKYVDVTHCYSSFITSVLYQRVGIRESVDSLCRDGADARTRNTF